VQNVRRQLNKEDTEDITGFKIPTEIVFRGLSESMRHPSDIEASIPQATRRWNKTPLELISDSDSESDIKPQNLNVYSPYYSPLQARKRQIQELEGVGGPFHFSLSSSLSAWFKGPVDRRSSL
jgi:hypothetical protein